MQLEEEGCLSVPGFNATVARPARAVVKGLDRHGEEQRVEGTGLLARCFQHEMDHLDGTLFVDRLRGLAEGPDRRKIKKLATPASGSAPAHRVLRHAAVCRPDARRLCSPRAHQVVGVVTQPDRPRGRGQKVTDAPVKAPRARTACRFCSRSDCATRRSDALAALAPDLGVVAAYGKLIPGDDARATPARHDQRPRVAAAEVSRRGARASRGHRRRGRDRRHDHADGRGARCRRRCSPRSARRSAPTRPATSSSATRATSAPRCLSRSSSRSTAGPLGGAAGRFAVHLCAATDEGRRTHRLDAPARRDPQPSRGLYPWPHAYTVLEGRALIVLKTDVRPGQHRSRRARSSTSTEGMPSRSRRARAIASMELQAEGRRPMTVAISWPAGRQSGRRTKSQIP